MQAQIVPNFSLLKQNIDPTPFLSQETNSTSEIQKLFVAGLPIDVSDEEVLMF